MQQKKNLCIFTHFPVDLAKTSEMQSLSRICFTVCFNTQMLMFFWVYRNVYTYLRKGIKKLKKLKLEQHRRSYSFVVCFRHHSFTKNGSFYYLICHVTLTYWYSNRFITQKTSCLNSLLLCICVCVDEEEEEDLSGLHPGALLYRSASLQHFPVMADALAHGADVNWVNVNEESKTPLIQAATVVSAHICESEWL